MKPCYLFLLLIFPFVSCFCALIIAKSTRFDLSKVQSSNSNGQSLMPVSKSRSLLSSTQDIIVVHSDGTLYLVDKNSGDVRWSFSSGKPVCSSFQALSGDVSDIEIPYGRTRPHLSNNYIDVGDDLMLVLKGPDKTFKSKLQRTPDELFNVLSTTPDYLGRQIVVASKKTEVFVLDASTGRPVSMHTLGGSTSNIEEGKGDSGKLVESIVLEPVQPMYIIRTDYFFQSTSPYSGKFLWNVSIAEFTVANPLQGLENPISQGSIYSRNGRGLEYQGDSKMALMYLPRDIVPYIRDDNDAEALFQQHKQLPNTKHDGGMIPLGERALPGPISNGNMRIEYKNPNYGNWWLTTIIGSLGVVATLLLYRLSPMNFLKQVKFTKQLNDSKTTVSKKKKARRLGNNKNGANFGKNNKTTFEEGIESNGLHVMDKNDSEPINGGPVGRKIGRLFVSNIEIARGSNGTVVLEGNYEGRPVAIKRLVKAHHDVASKEIQNLIASDRHPNIVRWYGVEYDSDFVYLSLERCACNLSDLIQICSASSQSSVTVEDHSENFTNEYNVRLDSLQGFDKDIELWKANGYPSTQLLQMMRDVVSGLAHLHELGIIHRDLKPQNVLILKQRSLCAKLSDMGISKRLIGDMSSLGHATGSGSSGWQAPEQLLHGRQTRAVDLFSLGCVLFFCITGGKHPFGDRIERDINIVKNRIDLFMVEHIPEAVDLLSHLLDSDPELRPKALDVLHHPLFWNSEMRLSFLRDTSDRVELEDRENESVILKALEAVAPVALGGKWDEKMETEFISNIGRYRRYKFDSSRDLLRVIRNKLNHYRELPKEIQEILGPIPEGFDGYFASRFPRFFIEVYKVMYKHCREEECFWKYFKSNLF